MAGFSGKNGTVKIGSDVVAEVTKWSFNPKSNNSAWASNSSGGYKKRVAGVKDGSGSLELKVDDTNQVGSTGGLIWATSLVEGSSVTLKLYIDATHFFSVPAVVDDISYDTDMNEGEVVGASVKFSTNGAWTAPT